MGSMETWSVLRVQSGHVRMTTVPYSAVACGALQSTFVDAPYRRLHRPVIIPVVARPLYSNLRMLRAYYRLYASLCKSRVSQPTLALAVRAHTIRKHSIRAHRHALDSLTKLFLSLDGASLGRPWTVFVQDGQ